MGEFFKQEVFRSVATLLVPGIVALSPFALKLILTYPGLYEFSTANPGAVVIISAVFSIVTGLILEDWGTWLETKWDALLDKGEEDQIPGQHIGFWKRLKVLRAWLATKWVRWFDETKSAWIKGEHMDFWNRYLMLTFKSEPEGQKYLLSLLVRMKFELSMVFAVPVSWLGFLWLHRTQTYFWDDTALLWNGTAFWIGSGLALLLTLYLLRESFDSAIVMAKNRKLLVEKYERDPSRYLRSP